MLAGDELVGTLSIGSTRPRRFQSADEQLVRVIAAQIVGGAERPAPSQHPPGEARVGADLRCHRRSRSRCTTTEASCSAATAPSAPISGLPVTDLSRLTCGQVGFCGCAGIPALRGESSAGPGGVAEITLPDGQIFSVTTFPIGPALDGPSVVQIAKNVTEEIASARRLQRMSQELATTNGRLVATLDQLQATQAQLVQAEKLSAIGSSWLVSRMN